MNKPKISRLSRILKPKDFAFIRNSSGYGVDYDIPQMLFAHGIEKGVLQQCVLSTYFVGGQPVIDNPYHSREILQPLTHLYAAQLAVSHIAGLHLGIDHLDNVATYLTSENVLVAPSSCEDAVEIIRTKLQQAYEAHKKWKQQPDPEIAQEVETKLRSAIETGARLRIPQVRYLFESFLQGYEEPDDNWLGSEFDHIRRDIDRSISGAMLGSIDTILSQREEDFRRKPNLRNARILDVFVRNHDALGFKSDKLQHYSDARAAYEKITVRFYPKKDRISAYASLIVFDMLLGLHQEKDRHLAELRKLAKQHPKAIFIEAILSGQKPPVDLGQVGLRDYYHPDLLTIMQDRLNSYGKDYDFEIPLPVHRMECLLDHCKKTRVLQSFRVKAHGKRYMYFGFNQKPYVAFSSPSKGFNYNGPYVVLLPFDGSAIPPDLKPEACEMYSSRENPDVAKLVEYDVDRYLLMVPFFKIKGSGNGAQVVKIKRKGYKSRFVLGNKVNKVSVLCG